MLYYSRSIDQGKVRTYHRPLSMDPLKAKVQLVVTEEMPILDILQGFYTTAVINVISWNKAYAIFARSTFLDFKTYSLKPLDPFFIESLRKYHRRGWQWEETLRRQDYSSTSSLQPLRRIGDKHTWIIHLPTQGVKKAYQPDLVLEHSHFGIVCRRSSTGPSGPMAHHLISAANFGHISLEHRFVTNGRGDFSSFLAPRLDSPARMGILQAEPEERPDWAQNITEMINDIHLYTSRGVKAFVPPKHWRTFDNEIPRWYKQWYRPASLEDVDNLFS